MILLPKLSYIANINWTERISRPFDVEPKSLLVIASCDRLMKLLRGTYGNDAVTRTTKGDQISVRLDGQTAVINLDTLVREQNLHFKVDITKNPEKAFNKNLSVRSALIIPMESMNAFYSSSLFLLFTLTCLHKSRILYIIYHVQPGMPWFALVKGKRSNFQSILGGQFTLSSTPLISFYSPTHVKIRQQSLCTTRFMPVQVYLMVSCSRHFIDG